jgi:Tir chaperone family protein CesT
MPDLREHASDLLRLIQETLPMEGEPRLEWDENDQCALTFDENLAVVITLDEVVEAIFLGWVLGELPSDAGAALDAMQELLEANHEWHMTEGGTLGLDPDTGLVTLSYRVDLPLDDPAVIQDIISKLYNICGHWQKTLQIGIPTDEEASAPSVRDRL